jgi:aquaporin Z
MTAERLTAGRAVREHWPEYLMEAWGLGTFMVSAGLWATLLEYPGSAVHRAIADPDLRRAIMGIAMGLTAIAIIYSPWGKRSGAHINPAVTLSFLRLGKINRIDAAFYIVAQFLGGLLGVLLVWAALGIAFADPPVQFVVTLPGAQGIGVAFLTEAAMACGLMLMVVTALASVRLMPLIGLFAGLMVATYIAFLAPLSGMSINPARTFASAAPGGQWGDLWLYLSAPVLGMLAAVEIHRLARPGREGFCAKLNHDDAYRCIHCGHEAQPATTLREAQP